MQKERQKDRKVEKTEKKGWKTEAQKQKYRNTEMKVGKRERG